MGASKNSQNIFPLLISVVVIAAFMQLIPAMLQAVAPSPEIPPEAPSELPIEGEPETAEGTFIITVT